MNQTQKLRVCGQMEMQLEKRRMRITEQSLRTVYSQCTRPEDFPKFWLRLRFHYPEKIRLPECFSLQKFPDAGKEVRF